LLPVGHDVLLFTYYPNKSCYRLYSVCIPKCGFGHTATIQFGREYCTARKPACLEDPEACPMADICEQVGVYPATGEVVDPVDAPE